jgi:hypothetical protein
MNRPMGCSKLWSSRLPCSTLDSTDRICPTIVTTVARCIDNVPHHFLRRRTSTYFASPAFLFFDSSSSQHHETTTLAGPQRCMGGLQIKCLVSATHSHYPTDTYHDFAFHSLAHHRTSHISTSHISTPHRRRPLPATSWYPHRQRGPHATRGKKGGVKRGGKGSVEQARRDGVGSGYETLGEYSIITLVIILTNVVHVPLIQLVHSSPHLHPGGTGVQSLIVGRQRRGRGRKQFYTGVELWRWILHTCTMRTANEKAASDDGG